MIALAGALGTLARHGLSGWTYGILGERFPWGTLAVNVLGCLGIGLIMEIALGSDRIPREWRIALTVGFLGGFTTFSTFAYETVRALHDGDWRTAALNVASNVALCLGATWIGWAAGRTLTGGS